MGSGESGFTTFSARIRDDAFDSTKIINFTTVYFPNVPEITRTNAIISLVGRSNIAVTNVSPSQLTTDIGSTVLINVTVVNEGYFSEIANLIIYVSIIAIKT